MMIDDRLSTNKVTMFNSLSRNINPGLQPPVVINWQNLEGGREQRRSKRTRSAVRGASPQLRTAFPCGGAVNLRGTFAATCAPSATVASSEPSVTAGWATLAAEHTRRPRGRGGMRTASWPKSLPEIHESTLGGWTAAV
ncbi:agouti signaling protein 1 isoform X4 [Nerophis ophidion]|nr:agouti signaling protein 1 isoform X4 [Nerophis ophidion]